MIWYWETWHPQKSDASGFGKSSSRGFYFTRLSRGCWMPTCCNLGFNQLNTPGWGERFGAMLLSTFPTWHGKNSTNWFYQPVAWYIQTNGREIHRFWFWGHASWKGPGGGVYPRPEMGRSSRTWPWNMWMQPVIEWDLSISYGVFVKCFFGYIYSCFIFIVIESSTPNLAILIGKIMVNRLVLGYSRFLEKSRKALTPEWNYYLVPPLIATGSGLTHRRGGH